MEKIIGKIKEITELERLKDGAKQDGTPWTLWGTNVILETGAKYSLSGFSRTEIAEVLEHVHPGDTIEFEAEHKGKYWNMNSKTIKQFSGPVPEQTKQTTQVPKEPSLPFSTMEECAREALKIGDILTDHLDDDPTTKLMARNCAFEAIMADRTTTRIENFKRGRVWHNE